MRRWIWVTWIRIGFHSYPTAPDEVYYLRQKHRHNFHYKVSLEVSDVDRELEFFMVQNALMDAFDCIVDEQDMGSCETQCVIISDIIRDLYPNRSHSVDVNEDNECGAHISSCTS